MRLVVQWLRICDYNAGGRSSIPGQGIKILTFCVAQPEKKIKVKMRSLARVKKPSGKESTCQGRRCKRHGFDPWVRKIPWRRARQPFPGFLPGESPWTEEPGRLQSMELHRVRHNWMDEHTQSNRTGVLIRKENEDADTYLHKGHSPARGTLTCSGDTHLHGGHSPARGTLTCTEDTHLLISPLK